MLTLFVGIGQLGLAVTGKPLRGVAECTFARPPYLARFEGALTGSARFDRPVNRLVFRAALLDEPIVSADPVAMQLARARCELELAALTDAGDFVGRVRAMTVTPAGFRPLGDVARRAHLSTRTLKRKLAEHGASFSSIVAELRRQRALLLLEHRDQSIGEIAARLGYSDIANFTRAFKRWTGKTPAAFRAP